MNIDFGADLMPDFSNLIKYCFYHSLKVIADS